MTRKPAMRLEELETDWLRRRITVPAAMPGLNNRMGAVQMEADIVALKHPVFPPYSAGNEVMGITLLDRRNLAQWVPHVEIRWRAYQVDRRCDAGGWHLESRTTLLPDQPGAVVSLRIENRHGATRRLHLGFLLSGRAMNTGDEGYAWAVPSIPTDVASFTREDGLGQQVRLVLDGAGVCLTNEAGNAHSVQCFSPPPDRWEGDRRPAWICELANGDAFELSFLLTFHADRGKAEWIARRWHGHEAEAVAISRQHWEKLWRDAFTPGNESFSGHLPVVQSPRPELLRLYYMGVLTQLTCRRHYGWGAIDPSYLTIWPRRGEGSGYLGWELPYISGIMARLDPTVLQTLLRTTMCAPWLDFQVVNFLSGRHGGWPCSAHPQAITTAALNLWRWQGDDSWRNWRITRLPRVGKGFEAASQGQVHGEDDRRPESLTGDQAFRQAVEAHRSHRLQNRPLVSFGGRGAYLECITTYAHGTAAHTAVQAWALQEAALLAGRPAATERDVLLEGIRSLYDENRGCFFCEYPDGRRLPAANLYDVGMVLNHVGRELRPAWIKKIVGFVRDELATPTWAHCLAPTDHDVASGLRADHQWAGCFSGWPPQFLLGVLRTGCWEPWLEEWINGLSQVTRQGPFAQAYWTEDIAEPEAGGAPKCFDDLPQGNHWVINSGSLFAEFVLDGVAGLDATADGHLRIVGPDNPLRAGLRVEGITHRNHHYVYENGLRKADQ